MVNADGKILHFTSDNLFYLYFLKQHISGFDVLFSVPVLEIF